MECFRCVICHDDCSKAQLGYVNIDTRVHFRLFTRTSICRVCARGARRMRREYINAIDIQIQQRYRERARLMRR